MIRARTAFIFAALAIASAVLPGRALSAEIVFPTGSRLGIVPPAELKPSPRLSGFEDQENRVFVRLVTLPSAAFAELDQSMTREALKRQGLTLEKKDRVAVAGAQGSLAVLRQLTPGGNIRKWMLVAQVPDGTALVSFETPFPAPQAYSDAVIRTALLSLGSRASVPTEEQLALAPFQLSDLQGLRIARVVPGLAVQLTDGTQDSLDALDQAHLVIAAGPGSPDPRDRETFARNTLTGLPSLSDFRVTNSESMRLQGQPGHEIRGIARDTKSGSDVEVVQWLRFGASAHLRVLGFAPKNKWADAFTRFRAVRDGLEPR